MKHIFNWLIKASAVICFIIVGLQSHISIYSHFYFFGAGVFFMALVIDIDEYNSKRKADKEQQLIDSIGRDEQ